MRLTKVYSQYLLPVGLVAGGIIGAGVFALPFAFNLSGLGIGFFYLATAVIAYCVIHLMYADVIVRTPGQHRFVGYAQKYLGGRATLLAIFVAIVEMIFVLTIYLILAQSFLALVVPTAWPAARLIAFWLFGSVAIFWKLRQLALSELLVTVGIVAIIAVLAGLGLSNPEHLAQVPILGTGGALLVSLPAILFALGGRFIIPALVNYARGAGGDVHSVIRRGVLWGTMIPGAVYGLFVLGVLAISPAVSEDAVGGLIGYVSPLVLAVIGVLGILTLWSSYIIAGLDVYDTLRYDVKLPPLARLAVVIGAPIGLYYAGFNSFLSLVSFTGGVFLSFEGLLIILMWRAVNRSQPSVLFKNRHRLAVPFLVAIFITALFAVIFSGL